MSFALVLTLLKNRYVQYGIAAVLLGALIFGITRHYINVGKEQGRQEVQQSTKEQIEQARSAERVQAVKDIAKADGEAQAAKAKADAFEAAASQFAEMNRTLISQRAEINNKINATPDAQLHSAITNELGLRPQNDLTAGYYPTEERALYSCVLNKPICEKSNQTQAKEIESHTAAIAQLQTTISALNTKFEAQTVYTTGLERHYTDLYNLFPKKYRSAKCVWLCTKKVVLPVPDPMELKKGK
jgi:hypothetical protein